MVEVLIHFQQQPRAGTSHEEKKAFILNYHFGWKTQKPFHLKILPHSLEDFRSTILHYVPDAPNMSDPSIYTEYEVYESKLKFIEENIHDGDAFHALDDTCDDGRKCTFYISRGTYSIVAMNSTDMSGCKHPYCEAYHYARMLETRFKIDIVGGKLYLKEQLHSRPADILVNNWHLGKPAAFDLTVTSPLNLITLTEAGVRCGSSALFAEARKHNANDSKCAELGWVCIPLAVESYGCWGTEAQQSFSRLAARLAIQMGCSKSQATTIVHQRLSLSLVRANARALLSRARLRQSEEGG
ncbi:hypothetical protein EMCRGX_G000809 [Ephydatia muelleri]